jgi:hypothetical protein
MSATYVDLILNHYCASLPEDLVRRLAPQMDINIDNFTDFFKFTTAWLV